MSMSKQHFEAIAGALADARASLADDPACVDGIDEATARVAAVLAGFNPRFDMAHFLAAARGDDAGARSAARARRS